MIVYFIRHSDTEWNKLKKLNGLTDVCLSDEGIDKANVKSKDFSKIGFLEVYCSELSRTYETAKIITQNRCKIIRDNKLNERDYGWLEGRKTNEVTLSEIESHSESHICIYRRVLKFLKLLESMYSGEVVLLVVTHLAILRHIETYITNSDYIMKNYNPLSGFIVQFNDNNWTLIDYC